MTNINIKTEYEFTLNGVTYARLYTAKKLGEYHFRIYNIYHTSQRLVDSRRFNEVTVNGEEFEDVDSLLVALEAVINRK